MRSVLPFRRKVDVETALKEPHNAVIEFRNGQGWGQYHNPKARAVSLHPRAAELPGIFYWIGLNFGRLNSSVMSSHFTVTGMSHTISS
jgi:hypothetical protein